MAFSTVLHALHRYNPQRRRFTKMFACRLPPLLATMTLALLLATPRVLGVPLRLDLLVGDLNDAQEQDTLNATLIVGEDGDTSTGVFTKQLTLNESSSVVSEDLSGSPEGDSEHDPIELAGAFEGDILLTNEQERLLNGDQESSDTRNAIKSTIMHWTGAEIPYVIASGQFSSQVKGLITEVMSEFEQRTCIKFVPRTIQRAYINIIKGNGCYSSVGSVGRRQTLSLGDGCHWRGTVIHELMHAAGFFHEQSRADRDDYIRINWDNIKPGMEHNFNKYDLNTISHLGKPYDLTSVMHYSANAFSRNGRPTIEVRSGVPVANMGQRNDFSQVDVEKL